jgi:hypothetical protein
MFYWTGHFNCGHGYGLYTYRITQLDAKITSLKGKKDLLVDISHLHHLEDKTNMTNNYVLEANILFPSKITDGIQKKFQ